MADQLPEPQVQLFNAKRREWIEALQVAQSVAEELRELGNGPWGEGGIRRCYMVFCCHRLEQQCKCYDGD
jgi:hypothetical protein